ncbi:MAG TPA: Uma2 family endonuclease [Polyangiaceae bacterium]|nr:Uma2 family endonuclease [Polyangiaceae bacterium]
MTDSFLASRTRPQRSYVRPPVPVHFPESAEMPETGTHLELRTALYLLVRDFVGMAGAVGSEQFVYWDPSDPRECLAPDLIVRIGAAPGPFPVWKTWERGAPHLAVEVVSPSDSREAEWLKKLASYRKSGINEIVRFAAEDAVRPLRLWDRFEGDLVERDLNGEHALLCDTLGVHWCVRSDPTLGRVLRLSRDALGQSLVPTAVEAAESQRAAAERERAEAESQRAAAESRIAELEAELRRR